MNPPPMVLCVAGTRWHLTVQALEMCHSIVYTEASRNLLILGCYLGIGPRFLEASHSLS